MTIHTADTFLRPRGAGLAARTKPNRALSTTTLLIAAALVIVLIGALLILATPSSTTVSRHVGHGASLERSVAPTVAVASAGVAARGRETLQARTLGAGRVPAGALLQPTATEA